MTGTSTSAARGGAEHDMLPPDAVIFGGTPRMLAIRHQLEKVSCADIPILIQGRGGSGKETLARWIHCRSPYSKGPFIKVNFAAIPGTLLESELFGYQAGAFTGAVSTKIGRIEMAHGGTLFLDQICDLDAALQAKLLQVLQDGRFSRLGDQEERIVRARIICASARRLEEAVATGQFRPDLYYRIKVFEIDLPPLAERRKDIPAIAQYLQDQLGRRFQRTVSRIEEKQLRLLQNRAWPGNIREMENWMARYVLLGEQELSDESSGGKYRHVADQESPEGPLPLKSIVRRARRAMSRELILNALRANRWNRRKTAKDLKISYRTLLYEIQEAGLAAKRISKGAVQDTDNVRPSTPSTD
jgi:two-component system, NtrC family, response regulator AtoC